MTHYDINARLRRLDDLGALEVEIDGEWRPADKRLVEGDIRRAMRSRTKAKRQRLDYLLARLAAGHVVTARSGQRWRRAA